MSSLPATLTETDLPGLDLVPAGPVNLLRDLYELVRFVTREGLTRTRRGNSIPVTAARRLAKVLSCPDEAKAVEAEGRGVWSDKISHLALDLGLIHFDVKGEYVGYSSSEPSFIDNHVEVNAAAFEAWLQRAPVEKERAILQALVQSTGSEFFTDGTLLTLQPFPSFGSAIGPASRMALPAIRMGLLELLSELEPGRFYDLAAVVDWLQRRAPHLILDPATREPDWEAATRLREWEWECKRLKAASRSRSSARAGSKAPPRPEVSLEDLYSNFRESDAKDRYRSQGVQLRSDQPDGFRRVEGRYLERFVVEIPYLCGFVSLAFRSEDDPHGLEVFPPLERLRGVQVTRRLGEVLRGDPALNQVTARCLPTGEVLLHAPCYPDRQLELLEPLTRPVAEDGPVVHLALDRKKITARAAREPSAPAAAAVLAAILTDPLPGNVSIELAAWEQRGEKVVIYRGLGLLELSGTAAHQRQLLQRLGDLVLDDGIEGLAVVRQPDQVFERLEQLEVVPLRVQHRDQAFRRGAGGRVSPPAASSSPTSPVERQQQEKPIAVRLEPVDVIAYRIANAEVLEALLDALKVAVPDAWIAREPGLLLLPATALPAFRRALRRLPPRFQVASVP